MLFFEEARHRAEADHQINPEDAHVLTRWGGALLELAHFRQGTDSIELIEQVRDSRLNAITALRRAARAGGTPSTAARVAAAKGGMHTYRQSPPRGTSLG
jgi:hypothetical protein